jgi:curved DNA-binding protein CbpA
VSVPDPYKTLQVDPEAERDVIEAAYRRLARKYHPDVSVEPGAVEKMVQINHAWEMLRDPVRRASVDRARAREMGTTARVVADDGKTHAAGYDHHASDPAHRTRPAPGPGWPIPGGTDPTSGSLGGRGEHGSPNMTSGRSTEGYRYDAATMGTASAGPPPGNPSGSIVTFGRYEGWTLGEIARRDLEYLEWLDRMPIGRTYQAEIDALLRSHGRRFTVVEGEGRGRGLFRRR